VRTRLIAAAGLVLTATPVTVAAAPAAAAAEPCTPSITIGKPFQDPGGFVVFPATYAVCDSTRVTVKFRDRDTDSGWAGGYSTASAGSSATTHAGTCHPDGLAHRWVAYATLKTPKGGQLIAQTAKVYFKSKPVTGNCAPWDPPAPTAEVL
jgi:hypothetical protein